MYEENLTRGGELHISEILGGGGGVTCGYI